MNELDQINGGMPLDPMQLRQAPAQPMQQEGGGLIDFFRSLFHRPSDLDDIMNQNGLRGPAQPYGPPTGGIRG